MARILLIFFKHLSLLIIKGAMISKMNLADRRPEELYSTFTTLKKLALENI